MILLEGNEYARAANLMQEAATIAKEAKCDRSKCGAVIVQKGNIIGKGFNSPPANDESQKRCEINKENYHKKVTDKTCCIHAEQRAIIDALTNNKEIIGSDLYFIRLNSDNSIKKAGNPYCTICSKLALDTGIKNFILWHQEGICSYNTKEYNELSFNYKE